MERQINDDDLMSPATIFIVDDEPTNVAVLQGVLESSGYQLMEAGNGREALDCLTDTTSDLILLALMMPKLDGFEVCQQVKTT